MENKLTSLTFNAEDWQLIVDALRVVQHTYKADAMRVGLDSTYGACLYDESAKRQALADDIKFALPE
jgi:hypothetical protein